MAESVDTKGKLERAASVPALADPRAALPRIAQVEWDHYYTQIALTVASRANCTGAQVGAVLVRGNRIISTGFNGTPAGFPNCRDGGCVRCRDRALQKGGRVSEVTYALDGDEKHLDLCICVHAEANALLSAARAGVSTADSTLYANYKPCFSCLKEAHQAGVIRIVYLYDWIHSPEPSLVSQYEMLAEHLRRNNQRNFERLARQSDLVDGTATVPREPNLDEFLGTPTTDDVRPSRAKSRTRSTRAK